MEGKFKNDSNKMISTEASLQLPDLDSESESDSDVEISSIRSLPTKTKRNWYASRKVEWLSWPVSIKYYITQDYSFIKQLGVGTYGCVKLAECKTTNQKVAIKIARGHTSTKYLQAEAEILKEIDSEFFPRFIDYKVEDHCNKSYLIMEYLEGKTLDEYLNENSGVDESKALSYLMDLTTAIDKLHRKGIVHRDLKPQNIIITDDSKLKIIDFNISKKSEKMINKINQITSSKFIGKFYTQISSPLFAAPELSNTFYYTESVDIWGIGVIFLWMLWGMSIFETGVTDENEYHTLAKAAEKWCEDKSSKTKDILRQVLCENPKERPLSSELLTILCQD